MFEKIPIYGNTTFARKKDCLQNLKNVLKLPLGGMLILKKMKLLASASIDAQIRFI